MPVEVSVDVSGMRELRGRFTNAAKETPATLRGQMQELGKETRDTMRAFQPKRDGELRRSTTFQTVPGPGGLVRLTVGATAKHAPHINAGTGQRTGGWIYPHGKFLVFMIGGRKVFARRVRGIKAQNFVAKTLDKVDFERRSRQIAAALKRLIVSRY